MGGRRDKPKETESQKAAAEIANKQWGIYQSNLEPFEDTFIQRVDAFNSSQNMDKGEQDVAVNHNQEFGKAREGLSQSLTSTGIDPSSGKYQSAMNQRTQDQALTQADTTNRVQSTEQDKYLAGLSDVVAMGDGQKGGALAGISDTANSSLRKSIADAQTSFNEHAAMANTVGTVAGAGVAYGLSSLNKYSTPPSSSMDGLSTIKPINTYDYNTNPNGLMIT